MKYILIDTNIFLDMLIDRKKQVPSKLVESFEKLLDFDEVKLIVPSIVVYETYKNIDVEFNKVSTNLKKAIKSIDDLYGVNAYKVNGHDIKDSKKKSKKELQEVSDIFEKNKVTYLKDLKRLTDKVFSHRNTFTINEDDNLKQSCYIRQMYKRAPLHIEGKDSTADGMIMETLINIKNYITINEDSELFFVSGNYADFSDNDNRDILHHQIVEDLERNGLDKKVSYIRTFHQLIGQSLAQEVINANLKEEFERELEEEEEEEQLRELQEMEYSDLYRESFGLSSLSSFKYNLEDEFSNCEFNEKVCGIFERINSTYSDFEEFASFYEYELLEYLYTLGLSDIEDAIKNMNEFFVSNGITTVDYSFEGICDIKDWILAKVEELNYAEYNISLPDVLEFGKEIAIIDVDKHKSYLIIDELLLSPDNGEQDDIDIRIKDESGNILARGYVQVDYGFMEEDDDGGIGDGRSEGVEYDTLEIEEEIERIASELESERVKNKDMIDDLRSRFNL